MAEVCKTGSPGNSETLLRPSEVAIRRDDRTTLQADEDGNGHLEADEWNNLSPYALAQLVKRHVEENPEPDPLKNNKISVPHFTQGLNYLRAPLRQMLWTSLYRNDEEFTRKIFNKFAEQNPFTAAEDLDTMSRMPSSFERVVARSLTPSRDHACHSQISGFLMRHTAASLGDAKIVGAQILVNNK